MRLEWRCLVAAATALTVGAICASGYARIATPYYRVVASLIALTHSWRVTDVRVTTDDSSPGTVVLLTGEVRAHRNDPNPAAIVASHVQTGEVIETPIVFWALLLMWPAHSSAQRWARLVTAIPVFLGLEAVTTPCQLLYAMARASAMLAGQDDPATAWERWSGFLEAGGRFALEIAAALVTIAAVGRAPHRLSPDVLADRRC